MVSVIKGSASNHKAGGVYVNGGVVQVENSTFASNNREGIYRGGGTVTILNSIIYFNNSNGTQVTGTATITYSDVQGGYTGEGNINVNPLLDPVTAKISKYSFCVDAGNPDPAYNDIVFDPPLAWGSYGTVRNDMGAHGGPGAALWEDGSGLPKFILLPGCGLIGAGDTVTLKVGVSGIPPFTYLWKKNGEAITDNPPHITGQGTDTLTITNATSADEGNYTVDVTNFMDTITSSSGGAMVSIDPLRVNVKMFAGLIIQAEEGKTVKVEYSNDLCSGSWTTLAQFVMPKPPYTYYDTDSPNHPKRFYRAAVVP
jgi:hypothetical protein